MEVEYAELHPNGFASKELFSVPIGEDGRFEYDGDYWSKENLRGNEITDFGRGSVGYWPQ